MDQHTHGAPKAPEGVALLGLLAFEGVEDTLVLASDLGEDARLDVGDEVPGGGLLGVHVGGDASPPGASYSVPICANMSAARYMAYQRCTTYFFSGTGNSMRVAS